MPFAIIDMVSLAEHVYDLSDFPDYVPVWLVSDYQRINKRQTYSATMNLIGKLAQLIQIPIPVSSRFCNTMERTRAVEPQ